MTILFYPEPPKDCNKIWYIIKSLGLDYTTNPDEAHDIAIRWYYTDNCHEFIPTNKYIINKLCYSIDKRTVDYFFAKAFGYSSFVDYGFTGPCVEKSISQCAKDGVIINHSFKNRRKNKIYQKLLTGKSYTEYRLYVTGGEIIAIASKVKERTGLEVSCDASEVYIEYTPDRYWQQYLEQFKSFIKICGCEYAELDVLIGPDNHPYIIDVNNIAGDKIFFQLEPDEADQLKKYLCDKFKVAYLQI